MFRWLTNRCGLFSCREYYLTSDEYKYDFKVVKSEVSPQNLEIYLTKSINNSTEHIYEEVSDAISYDTGGLAYAVTSLFEIIDCETSVRLVGDMCLSKVLDAEQCSDNGYESKQSLSEETEPTTSSCYQPIAIPATYLHRSTKKSVDFQHSTSRCSVSNTRLVKYRSKCRRWLSNKLTNIHKRYSCKSPSFTLGNDQLQFSHQRINDNMSVSSEQSSLSDMGSIASSEVDDEKSFIIEMEESLLGELPYFNPTIGFGLNKWYRR